MASESVIAKYDEGGGRLTDYVASYAEDDDKRIAYMKLIADKDMTSDFPQDIKDDRAVLESIFSEIKNEYRKFVITGVGIDNRERVNVMTTFGDSFAATFTGKEPLILAFSGFIVFDYAGKAEQSWFHAFLNAYEYYLRGSRLAKWRAKLQITIPDVCEYKGYMMNLSTQMNADNDTVLPFQFSFLVTDQTIFKSLVENTKPKVDSKASSWSRTRDGNTTETIDLSKWDPDAGLGGVELDPDKPLLDQYKPYADGTKVLPVDSRVNPQLLQTNLINKVNAITLSNTELNADAIANYTKVDPKELIKYTKNSNFTKSIADIFGVLSSKDISAVNNAVASGVAGISDSLVAIDTSSLKSVFDKIFKPKATDILGTRTAAFLSEVPEMTGTLIAEVSKGIAGINTKVYTDMTQLKKGDTLKVSGIEIKQLGERNVKSAKRSTGSLW